ncbi:MAG TPA: formylglycine-generating enzyme family protein [Rhizomicrobium sp.]|nr:formylglycine-generating enzyme family protein [Rhizomicrobium sp.]
MKLITALAIVLIATFARASMATAGAAHESGTFRDCAICPEMVAVPAGSFTIGSPKNEPGRSPWFGEEPQKRVTVHAFGIGKFDVTKRQWAAFVEATQRPVAGGCKWSELGEGNKPNPQASWRHLGFVQGDDHPAVCISWEDAQDYVHWLSKRTGHLYRLPTEAEWEYAARAGTITPYPWGTAASHEYANYGAETCCHPATSGRDRWIHTSPVGSFPPNRFGLYDMHGNVLQWVEDCFSNSYADLPADASAYKKSITLHMTGDLADLDETNSCSYHVLRGSDWNDPPSELRSAFRNMGPEPGETGHSTSGIGFRVAMTL